MPKDLFKAKFDPNANYIARRAFGDYQIGDKFVKENFTPHRVKQMYSTRMIVMEDVWNEFVGVTPAPTPALPVVDPAPVDDGEVPSLREEYKQLTGKDADKRWGEARLVEELEKATAPAPALPGMADG